MGLKGKHIYCAVLIYSCTVKVGKAFLWIISKSPDTPAVKLNRKQ